MSNPLGGIRVDVLIGQYHVKHCQFLTNGRSFSTEFSAYFVGKY